MSDDRGATWKLMQTVVPEKKKFEVNLTRPGLYWFRIVITSKDGRREPGDLMGAAPMLRVLVRTQDRSDQPTPRPAKQTVTLAGRVVDTLDQKPPKTYLRVVDTTDLKAAPIDVEADGNGYFTIQGLEEKKQYCLIARARDGDRFLIGNVLTTAPKDDLVIKIQVTKP